MDLIFVRDYLLTICMVVTEMLISVHSNVLVHDIVSGTWPVERSDFSRGAEVCRSSLLH